jgi:Skp family chaperone for outer membrane proteins
MNKLYSGVAAVATAGAFCALAAFVLVALSGCDKGQSNASPSASGGGGGGGDKIGIVDLDKLSRDVGWRADLDRKLSDLRARNDADFSRARDAYTQQLAQKKKDLGISDTDTIPEIQKKTTPQQQQELNFMVTAGSQILQQYQAALQQQINEVQAVAQQQWGQKLLPLVTQVAQEKKLAVVLSQPAGNILYHDGSTDITVAVVAAVNAKPPVFEEIKLKQINVPASIFPATQPTSMPTGPLTTTGPTTSPTTPTGFRP